MGTIITAGDRRPQNLMGIVLSGDSVAEEVVGDRSQNSRMTWEKFSSLAEAISAGGALDYGEWTSADSA